MQVCFLSQFVQAFCVLEIGLIVIVVLVPCLLLHRRCLALRQIPLAEAINSHGLTHQLMIIVVSPPLFLILLVVERTVALLASASVDLAT